MLSAYGVPKSGLDREFSNWQPYNLEIIGPGGSFAGGMGTVDYSKSGAWWRRSGKDSIEIRWVFTNTSGGSATSSDYTFTLPPGFHIDTSVLPAALQTFAATVALPIFGSCLVFDGVSTYKGGIVMPSDFSDRGVRLMTYDGVIVGGSTVFKFETSGIGLSFHATIPVVEYNNI